MFENWILRDENTKKPVCLPGVDDAHFYIKPNPVGTN